MPATRTDSDQRSTQIEEIDEQITYYQDIISSLCRSQHHQHGPMLSSLALARLLRYNLSDDRRDLEMSVSQSTHAIFLSSYGHFLTENDENVFSTLSTLAMALFLRSRDYKQLNDIEFCIKCLRFLRDSAHKVPGITHGTLAELLIDVLALRAELEIEAENGIVIQSVEILEEMLGLCGELFTLDTSAQDLEYAIEKVVQVVKIHVFVQWNRPPQQVIKFLHEANRRLPNLPIVFYGLILCYFVSFHMTMSNSDYEHAMVFLDKFITPHGVPSPLVEYALDISATLAKVRFNAYGNPEYLDEAIFRCRTYLNSISPEHPERGYETQTLARLERTRFHEFGITTDLPGARSDNLEVVGHPSFSQLAASLTGSNAIESHLIKFVFHYINAVRVFEMDRTIDEVGIEEAAKCCRLVIELLHQSPKDITTIAIHASGDLFLHAFKLTNNPGYLNEAIDAYRSILNLPSVKWMHFSATKRVISSLIHRIKLFRDRKDLDEIMRLCHIAATDTLTKVPDRFKVSCEWAENARNCHHASTSTAYEVAISLMQNTLTFAPTLEIQHFHLVARHEHIEKLPLDYASYQMHTGQLEDAIEILERGRGLLWSELRGLRTPIDQLRQADLHLAEKFADISQELEALTTSGSQNLHLNDGDVDSGDKMGPFGRIVVKQRNLLDERTRLITKIRSLPGFESFLEAPSFETLRSAAAHGPVVIINHCRWRSDIIILLHNAPPSLIPTTDDFYECATVLKEHLLAARNKGLDSMEYGDALTSILASLYDLVGRPVIQRLRELNVPEQSRIWWCPTSVFCSLPLHAMGPIRSEGLINLYFSDLYISSYTPTLSALIESHKPGSHSFEKPSILLVAQPDESMPLAWREISLVCGLETTVTTLCSKKATPSAVMQHFQDHRFAHFTCHGILETGKPFDAAFKLYQEERLTLLEIIRSHLLSAEFAFLSACHTAELTEESIVDEGLHLSAAVQYSGFRSVVGTIWAVADIDGPFLVKHFYASLFSERWQGVPYYARTAEALRDAVRKLRMKGVSTERWVNFVHYGA